MVRKILQLKNKIVCWFLEHKWEGVEGTWRPTGKTTCDWALNIVPEYEREERCTRCGATKTEKYISFIDTARINRKRS